MQQLELVFRAELEDYLQVISDGLLAMEQGPEPESRQPLLEELFRVAHSLKGAAKSVSHQEISQITHCLESIFSLLKKDRLACSAELIDALLLALDNIKLLANDRKALSAEQLQDFLESLKAFLRRPAVPVQDFGEGDGKTAAVIDANGPALQVGAENALRADAFMNAQGSDAFDDGGSYSILAGDVNQLSLISEEMQISALRFKEHLDYFQHLCAALGRLAGVLNEAAFRAEGSDIHDMLHKAGLELNRLSGESFDAFHDSRQHKGQFRLLSQDLEYSVNRLRLVRFSVLLAPLHRIVRDLSQRQCKQVNFTISGGDIKIDRHLYKNLHDALLHLINNAIDHGIETRAERIGKGKSEEAELNLRIFKEGADIQIRLADDGCGIDGDQIKKKLLSDKMLPAAEVASLTEDETLEFVFRQGFSLAKIISDISGRGVGLDIVRTNLQRIKGTVRLKSRVGEGTEFILNLPASLTSESGVLVGLLEQKFALQGHSIEKVADIAGETLQILHGRPVCFAREEKTEPVPVFYLADLLGTGKNDTSSCKAMLACVFIRDANRIIALVVDCIIGEQELVIKPFSYPLLHVPFAVGMTTLGCGELVPVLNSAELIHAAFNGPQVSSPLPGTGEAVCRPKILVVDDSSTSRTLEKNILEQHGCEVKALMDGQQAWEELQLNPDYDLVVTDVEMPLMNGFELVENIKGRPVTENIPVIIVSSLNSEQDRRHGVQVGADAYISKDLFDSDRLLTLIDQLL